MIPVTPINGACIGFFSVASDEQHASLPPPEPAGVGNCILYFFKKYYWKKTPLGHEFTFLWLVCFSKVISILIFTNQPVWSIEFSRLNRISITHHRTCKNIKLTKAQ